LALTTSVSSTQALGTFSGTESVEVSGFVEAVEDTECAGSVALGPPYDDPVGPFGLDRSSSPAFRPARSSVSAGSVTSCFEEIRGHPVSR
jgi:hypothetical protein